MFDTPEARWQALQTRNPRSASAFIYGVTTTGIFCRPTCPARLARRANVVFFDTVSEAAASGLRACKRCKPAHSDFAPARSRHEAEARRACEVLRAANGRVGLVSLASSSGMSPRYFHGVFKRVVGVTPGTYAARLRMGIDNDREAAASLLEETERANPFSGLGDAQTGLLETATTTPLDMGFDSGYLDQDVSFNQLLNWIAIYGESNTTRPDVTLFEGPQPALLDPHSMNLQQPYQNHTLPLQPLYGLEGDDYLADMSIGDQGPICPP